jgi:hypothetical protein
MFERTDLALEHFALFIVARRRDEPADSRELVIILVERCVFFYDLHEPLVLAAQRCHQSGIAERLRVEQLPFNFRRAADRVGEEIPEAQTVAG